jgi:hypothetical protein
MWGMAMSEPAPLNNVIKVTKEMAARVVEQQRDNPKCVGIIVLSLGEDGGYHSTITDGCYSKMFGTIGILSYAKSIFEADCRRLNEHEDD